MLQDSCKFIVTRKGESMKIRAWLHSSLDGEESYVDIEMNDNASDDEINREVNNIAEQYYADESEWEIIHDWNK